MHAGICSSTHTHTPSPWEALKVNVVTFTLTTEKCNRIKPILYINSLFHACIVYRALSCCKHCEPFPGRSVLVFRILQLYVGCGSINQPYLLNSSAVLHFRVRATCFLIETVTVLYWWEWTDRRTKLTAMQMEENSHLSHAWQGLKAPEVYLFLFHSLPLNCSYASMQLGHS